MQNTRIQWTCRRWPTFVLLMVALAPAVQSRASSPSSAYTIHSTSNGFSIQVSSGTETLNYQWIAPPIASLYSLGSMLITDSVAGASPAGQLPVASSIDWIGPSQRLQSIAYQTSGPVVATLTFAGPTGTTHITLVPMVIGQFAAIRMTADRATIKAIHLGQLPPAVVTQQVTVPYYSQAVNYIDSLDLFENAYFDQFDSRSTTVSNTAGPEAFYATNNKGTANLLGEIWKISASQNIMNVLPAPAHPASPYMAQLAGRMVLEVRSGNFSTIAAQLANG